MKKVTPFLMFEGKAEEAMTLYCETIPDSSVLDVTRYGHGEDRPEGTLKLARVSIGGLDVMVFNSPVHHAFTFTPSASLYVDCSSEQEQPHCRDNGKGRRVPDAARQLWFQPPFRMAERQIRCLLAGQPVIASADRAG